MIFILVVIAISMRQREEENSFFYFSEVADRTTKTKPSKAK